MSVTSTTTPVVPSAPTNRWRRSGPIEARGTRGVSMSSPVGRTTVSATMRSSMLPYRDENWPAARVATQPPTEERSSDCGEWPSVSPRSWSSSSSSRPSLPAWTRTIRLVSSRSSTRDRAAMSSAIPPRRGRGAPVTADPRPQGVTGTPRRLAHAMSRTTWSTVVGRTTTAGRNGCFPCCRHFVATGQASKLWRARSSMVAETAAGPSNSWSSFTRADSRPVAMPPLEWPVLAGDDGSRRFAGSSSAPGAPWCGASGALARALPPIESVPVAPTFPVLADTSSSRNSAIPSRSCRPTIRSATARGPAMALDGATARPARVSMPSAGLASKNWRIERMTVAGGSAARIAGSQRSRSSGSPPSIALRMLGRPLESLASSPGPRGRMAISLILCNHSATGPGPVTQIVRCVQRLTVRLS